MAARTRHHGNQFVTESARTASVLLRQLLAGEHGPFDSPGRNKVRDLIFKLWNRSFSERLQKLREALPAETLSFIQANPDLVGLKLYAPEIRLDREIYKMFGPYDPARQNARVKTTSGQLRLVHVMKVS